MASASGPRRFPPPWRTEPIPAGWLVVDANGTKLAYIYGVDPRAQTSMAGSMSFNRAEVVAAAIAVLPEVLRGERPAPDMGMPPPFHVDERDGWFRVVAGNGYGVATVYCVDPRAGDLA